MSPSAFEPTIIDRFSGSGNSLVFVSTHRNRKRRSGPTTVISLDHQNQPSLVRYLDDSLKKKIYTYINRSFYLYILQNIYGLSALLQQLDINKVIVKIIDYSLTYTKNKYRQLMIIHSSENINLNFSVLNIILISSSFKKLIIF